MRQSIYLLVATILVAYAGLIGPAFALNAQECSAKFQSAKAAGKLNGQSWSEFRKAQCGSQASAGSANPLRQDAPPKTSGAVFPTAIAAEFAALKPAQARRKTCAKQFQANKANQANGGLTWLAKGGGYYSQCNQRLKRA